jgi:hypothetical protein
MTIHRPIGKAATAPVRGIDPASRSRMERNMAKTTGVRIGVLALAVMLTAGPVAAQTQLSTADHPAVGSYYGKAVQVCAPGVAPSACFLGTPAASLLMTLSLTADGQFIGIDSTTLLSPPFGPHGEAHGSWVPTSLTEFTAEYVFLSPANPPPISGVFAAGVRARWQAKAVDADTLVGWVNAYFLDPVPVVWTRLVLDDDFPTLPPEAAPYYAPAGDVGFIKDPSLCRTSGCPQVFKFTVKRIRR